jgi:RNA polymerase sigma-70 factor (ECF subfamily)
LQNPAPDIILGCAKQDRRAQNALYNQYHSVLLGVCHRYVRSEDEAVGLLNLGFLKILNNIDKYNEELVFVAWAKRILINTIIDEFRKNKNHREQIKYQDFEEYHSFEGAVDFNFADQNLDIQHIYAFIQELPAVSRQVFNLSIIDGYTHAEIGKMIGIAEGTSKWHLSFARKFLMEKINKINNHIQHKTA